MNAAPAEPSVQASAVAVVRADLRDGLGRVTCDTVERVNNEEINVYDPPGSLLVVVHLPVDRAEVLVDALDSLDENAERWRSNEHAPTGWGDVCRGITAVTAELERRGLIEADS